MTYIDVRIMPGFLYRLTQSGACGTDEAPFQSGCPDDLALSDLIVDEVNGSFGQNTSEIVLGMILQVLTAHPAVESPSPEPV